MKDKHPNISIPGLTIMAELERNICIQTIHFCIAFYSKTVLKSRHWFVVVNIHVNKTLTQNIEHAHKYVSSFRC
jgi:hypothetical protein